MPWIGYGSDPSKRRIVRPGRPCVLWYTVRNGPGKMKRKIALLRHVSGHTYDTVYDLVFTTERMLALIVWHPGGAPVRFGMMEMFIGGQLSRLKERAAKGGLIKERRSLHEEKRLDEVIGLHRLNFEIPYRSNCSPLR